MTNLVIDIGNTLSKLALFNNKELVSVTHLERLNPQYLEKFLEENSIHNSVISSVNTDVEALETILKSKTNYLRFKALSPSKVVNRYKTPQTLGLDRYAAAIGAQATCPNQNCLVIDAGSCITYDFIDAEKNYWGGSISPGIQMRFKAMNMFTGKLPLISADFDSSDDYGTDTKSSMVTGVLKGAIYEALGFIGYYISKWPDLKVLLCGGDINFFDKELKNSIFARTLKAEAHLVLIGLNEVILYNND